ncbi:hypothetical protein PspLS_00979 [Pyricularia sp. CBS 133598]|nr:hypothetical protein PspLS_00979 [Pyricularia sp. CBS 133598]
MELSKVHLVSVFTASDSPDTGGNLLPVVLDASALSEEDMRRIAREYEHEASFLIPLSEASSESQKVDYQLRFFVPEHEMEMCGHATVGTTWLLGELGILSDDQTEVCYTTKSGLVRARRHKQEGDILVEVSQPQGWARPVQDEALRQEIAAVLGESGSEKIDTGSIQNACTSRAKTMVLMRDPAALDALKPDFSRMQALCEKLGSTGLYPYALHSDDSSSNSSTLDGSLVVHARQFPKASGYPEDAATGIAAAALSFALLENKVLGEDRNSAKMSFGGQTPTIIVLKEGTDSSQGKGQIVSNINACLAVQATIKSTLGPYGGDLLMVDANGKQTITNDGATVMKLLDIVHPAARILVDIARSQDAEVGDGTTSVVVLAGEILKEIKEHVEQGVSSQIIVKGLRRASSVAVNKIKEIAVSTSEGSHRETLTKLAGTAMTSKLIKRNTEFFTKMVVDAVLTLDQEDLNEKLIGIKKIPGGSLTDSLFVNGVAFKKTFSYAGFEQQPKSFTKPKIVCLNVELELKAEKDNAEVRVEQVSEYQAIVDAEWQIIFKKLEAVYKTGAKVVLSKLPIGDLATQYFADRDIFCAGRVASEDMERVVQATGATVQSTCSDILPEHLGTCGSFEERQIGGERFNFFEDCPEAKTCTLVLRGGAEQFIAEVERSLHDAIMIVKRAIRNRTVVAGGGAVEMEVSAHLHRFADLKNQAHKQQAIIKSFAKALEIIPRQLCDNAGFDATDILNKLRVEHRKGNTWAGVDFQNEGVADLMERFVWEPALIKTNAIQAATEACCLILSVDETIRNEESAQPQAPGQALPPGAAQRALRGRGRGMPRR